MKTRHFALVFVVPLSISTALHAQTSYFWRAEASNGNWSLANFAEFAFDKEPLSGSSSVKTSAGVHVITGGKALTLTLPARNGAVFNGSTARSSDPVDGVIYQIEGSGNLAAWDLVISVITGDDAAVLQESLPAPSTGWTYRTFRVTEGPPTDAKQFIRASAR